MRLSTLRVLLTLVPMLALAGVLVRASGPTSGAAVAPTARLTAISSRLHGKASSLIIEATVPVPYVTMRPDPLTILIDFRNVGAEGVTNSVTGSDRSPVATVAVESVESMGAPASRVRITLVQPVVHRVRSERNTVVVDFDKPSRDGVVYLKPAMRQSGAANTKSLVEPVETPTRDPIAALELIGLQSRPSLGPARPPASADSGSSGPQTGRQQSDQPAPGQRRFTGHPVSLDFQGADLRSVLRTFAEISSLNMVIDPAVQGTVEVALRDVPWDQALDMILRANKLGYLVDGNIVRIAPLTVLADEEAQRRKLADEQALAGELHVLTKTLSYAKAEDLQQLLTKSALSSRGTAQVDPRTNTLIITDLQDRLTTASDLITTLDRAQPQVEIEARIVQTNKNYARVLGIQWGFLGRVDPTLGNTTPLAFPNSGSLGGRTGGQQGPNGTATAVNLGVQGAPSAVGLALGSVNGAFNLDMVLSALETSGNGRILSTPRVSTQNNVEAEIMQGVQIPIQIVANNTITVSFKDAALTLKVIPQITAAGTVIMKIAVENASPDFTRSVNNIPPINTQRATTSVLVNDGQTTVIGGIYTSTEQAQTDRTPGLGSIPLIRWLFKRDSVNDQSTELLIFITPKIIKG
jgi:type IV pilus assembly protein PilQ